MRSVLCPTVGVAVFDVRSQQHISKGRAHRKQSHRLDRRTDERLGQEIGLHLHHDSRAGRQIRRRRERRPGFGKGNDRRNNTLRKKRIKNRIQIFDVTNLGKGSIDIGNSDNGVACRSRRFHETVDGLRLGALSSQTDAGRAEIIRLSRSLRDDSLARHTRLSRLGCSPNGYTSPRQSLLVAIETSRRRSRRLFAESLHVGVAPLRHRRATGARLRRFSVGKSSTFRLVLLLSHRHLDVYGQFGRLSHRPAHTRRHRVGRRSLASDGNSLRHRSRHGRRDVLQTIAHRDVRPHGRLHDGDARVDGQHDGDGDRASA